MPRQLRLLSIGNIICAIFVLMLMVPQVVLSFDRIRTDRPRLLFDTSDLNRVRYSLGSYGKGDYLALKNFAARRLVDLPASKLGALTYDPKQVAAVAFIALLEENKELIRRAIDYGLFMAKTPATKDDVTAQRYRLLSMAYIYDWLHDKLTATERLTIKTGIIAHIKQLNHLLSKPLYTGGHSRYAAVTIMAGLIALSDQDWPTDRTRLLEVLQTQWETGYNRFQSFVADEGGYYMGWRYGASYAEPLAYLFWEKATGVRWGNTWRARQTDWLLYGIRGDGTLPRTGDSWDTSLQDDNITALTAVNAGLFRDRRAEWLYREYFSDCWEPRRLFRLLFADPTVEPQAPWLGDSPLPQAKHFGNSGLVVARDGWDATATHLVFKSTPFYTRNHHHKDQNSFELSYRGSLLIDSGVYDAFGTPHWKNYYTRTIAHNTLVVFDPDERFVDGLDIISNDGGQYFPAYSDLPVGREPETLEEASSEKYKRDGVTGFGTTNGVTWVRGNASKAYTNSKLTTYLRDMLMINQPEGWSHPFLLVLDRVRLAKPLTPTILFHSNEAPIVTRDGFSVANKQGGMVYGTVLAPASVEITAIGGAGKEWWVNGVNYHPASKGDKKGIDPGAWRVEVGTSTPTIDTEFLTFLAIGGAGEPMEPPSARVVSTAEFSGAIVGDALYLIFKGESLRTSWSFEGGEFIQVRKIFVGGLPQGREYHFFLNKRILSTNSAAVMLAAP